MEHNPNSEEEEKYRKSAKLDLELLNLERREQELETFSEANKHKKKNLREVAEIIGDDFEKCVNFVNCMMEDLSKEENLDDPETIIKLVGSVMDDLQN